MKRNEGIHRHDISDEARERIKELLHGQAGKREEIAKDKRLFINAVAWQTRTAPRGETYHPNSGTGTTCISGSAAGWTREYGNADGRRNKRAYRGYLYDRFDVYQGARGRTRCVSRQSEYQPYIKGG